MAQPQFKNWDAAVRFLEGGGWARSGTDVMTYFRNKAKARIEPAVHLRNGRIYKIVYSKKRTH